MGLKPRPRRVAEHKNYILFEHPKRAARKLIFQRQGRKGMYVEGGVWGEKDWFMGLDPDGENALQRIKAARDRYLRTGFTIARTRIHVRKYATTLGLPFHNKAKPRKKPDDKYLRESEEVLARAKPEDFDAFKRDIKDMRRLWQESLTRDLRNKLSERLTLRLRELSVLASKDKRIAARARHVLPPEYLSRR